MSGIRVGAGAIRYSADIAWYDIKNYALSAKAEDRYDYLCHKKKKEELRSIGEGPGWPLLI